MVAGILLRIKLPISISNSENWDQIRNMCLGICAGDLAIWEGFSRRVINSKLVANYRLREKYSLFLLEDFNSFVNLDLDS